MARVRGRCSRLTAPAFAIAALWVIGPAPPAAAQALPDPSAPASASPVPPACQLHVWPAATTHTTYYGWVHGGAIDGAQRGINGYPDVHANALDTPQQAHLLATVDWRGAFNDPALDVVVHDAAAGAADDRTRTSRKVAGATPPCYRELIITSSFVQSDIFSKPTVRVMALRKRFDGAGAAPANFSSMSEASVLVTEADKAAPDAGARVDAALHAAFVTAVNKFAVMQSFH